MCDVHLTLYYVFLSCLRILFLQSTQANEVVTHLESRCKTLEDRCTEVCKLISNQTAYIALDNMSASFSFTTHTQLAQQVIDMQKAELQLRQDISGISVLEL